MEEGRTSERGGRSRPASGASEVVQAIRISAEPGLELAQVPRVIAASAGIFHSVSMRLVLKWIPEPA